MRAALYARVSTTHNGQDPAMQTRELREYCLRRGWEIAVEYVEVEHGNVDSRPQLNELFRQAKRRRFDAVVVYRYDRFARSMRQLVNALAEFNGLGINFVSLHEGVDTSTPQGRLFFGIIASLAEFERELICSRVRSGLAAARAKGKTLGRPRKVVDASRIAALRAQGTSWRTISRELGVSLGTVYATAHNRSKNPTRSKIPAD
jgi:DNA invertase Pin-like site-specific DNA recombinase